jgi:transcriptional repressor NrdR
VTEDDLALIAQRVEETIRAAGSATVDSHDVGMAILGPLRELDEVAYLRFASVYRSFDSLEDFDSEISLLRTARDLAAISEEDEQSPDQAPARGRGSSSAAKKSKEKQTEERNNQK